MAWLNNCPTSHTKTLNENFNGAVKDTVENARQGNRDLIKTGSSAIGQEAGLRNEGVLTVNEFMEHMMQLMRKGIQDEFVNLKRQAGIGNFQSAISPENRKKNRHLACLCHEESRVKLVDLVGETKTDYIHANYMDGYKQQKAYIATQGPLPNTKSDFWQMVWEQQVYVVVMITRCIERHRIKSTQYWPENRETNQFATVNVTHQETVEFEDHVARIFLIRHEKSGETRRIVHFQMTSWPDFGVPSSAESCLHVVGLAREAQTDAVRALGSKWKGHPKGPPIVVHCGLGSGRTGIFCTIDVNMARLSDVGKCDVFNTVKQFRTQRALIIQTVQQYEFCHLAILEHALGMPSTSQEEKKAIRDFLEGWKMQQRDNTD